MPHIIHSVELDREKCYGCTNCIKRCPTEAIRVRGGKAVIINDRCIDCGECIRICPHKAKKASFDKFDITEYKRYKIALPAPALYGQFDNIEDVDIILNGLLEVGFDDVFEVSRAAEIISEYTRRYIAEHSDAGHPFISTACPAVVRLITVRFPYLCDYLLPVIAPIELAAKMAKTEAVKKHPELNLTEDDVGVYFITPCPAKVSYIRNPIGVGQSAVDGALSMSEIYLKLVSAMKKIDIPKMKPLSRSGIIGISWAATGGEAAALLNERYLAADGIENVIKVLDEIENENFSGLNFIELNACAGGCVGGALAVENAYIAKARIQKLRKFLPLSQNRITPFDGVETPIEWEKNIDYNPVMKLDDNMKSALEMRANMEKIAATLPGLDCGSCGAPSCKCLAEDIVRGKASESFCIFKMREKIQGLYQSMSSFGFMENMKENSLNSDFERKVSLSHLGDVKINDEETY